MTTTTCTCNRCGGGRTLPQFKHVAAGVCFECHGAGTVEKSTAGLKAAARRREKSAAQAAARQAECEARVAERAAIQARLQPVLETRFGSRCPAQGAYRFHGLCELAEKAWGVAACDLAGLERMAAA